MSKQQQQEQQQQTVKALGKRHLAENIPEWRDCVCDFFQVLNLLM